MTAKMQELIKRENEHFRSCGGYMLEADEKWNNIQREKIAAVYKINGKAYLGKINHHGENRKSLTVSDIFVEYTGQKVYNFDADFIVPTADNELAEMIIQWNAAKPPLSLKLIKKMQNIVEKIGGTSLKWY